MRGFAALALFLAVLASSALAEELVLPAHMSTSPTASVPNCAATTPGPSKTQFSVAVENTLSQLLDVDYSVFDNSTGTWREIGNLCIVPAGQTMQCPGTLETTLGGTGNGTFTSDMLRLTGRSDASPGNVYVETIPFSVQHFTGAREQALLSQKSGQDSALLAAKASCAARPQCCPAQTRGQIDEAEALLLNASAQLAACATTGMYSSLVSAESLLLNASSQMGNCTTAATPTPGVVATPAPSPSGSQTPTPSPAASPTPPPAATATPTPAPSGAGACPLAVLLLAAGALSFAASKN
ncbi:MAG: hypothetical protein PHF51_03365 [Candidatus ainarchaeum sp.]|nr:hypothetical protein [Candidatus ainarchaeum sp.]